MSSQLSASASSESEAFLKAFRHAAPYVQAHRGRTVVVVAPSYLLGGARASSLRADLCLLHALGLRVVLVLGTRRELETALQARQLQAPIVDGVRVTDEAALSEALSVAGATLLRVSALLSERRIEAPRPATPTTVQTGNFVQARPRGLREGQDYGLTGVVQSVDAPSMARALEAGSLVLVPPLGHSPAGELFNLSAYELGRAVAVALEADKLVLLADGAGGLAARCGASPAHSTPDTAMATLDVQDGHELATAVAAAAEAVRSGVARAHVLDSEADGALLLELFTRDGAGLLVSRSPYEVVRQASPQDLNGIAALLELEASAGTVLPRARRDLRSRLASHVVVVRDGMVVATAALDAIDQELGLVSALAVHPAYRNQGLARAMLAYADAWAKASSLPRLLLRTTQSEQFFSAFGFERVCSGSLEARVAERLPAQRAAYLLERVVIATPPARS